MAAIRFHIDDERHADDAITPHVLFDAERYSYMTLIRHDTLIHIIATFGPGLIATLRCIHISYAACQPAIA